VQLVEHHGTCGRLDHCQQKQEEDQSSHCEHGFICNATMYAQECKELPIKTTENTTRQSVHSGDDHLLLVVVATVATQQHKDKITPLHHR